MVVPDIISALGMLRYEGCHKFKADLCHVVIQDHREGYTHGDAWAVSNIP